MNLVSFVQNKLQRIAQDSWSVLFFTGKKYPLLFFSDFFDALKRQGQEVQQLDLEVLTVAEIIGQLSISFLGMSNLYWCRDLSNLDRDKKKELLDFFLNYKGPHKLIFFCNEGTSVEKENHLSCIDFDIGIAESDLWSLFNYFYDTSQKAAQSFFAQSALKSALDKNGKIDLDVACQIMRYEILFDDTLEKIDTITQQLWVDRIITPTKSLFTLSQYFFAKDRKRFMSYWHEVVSDYPPEFWVVYWTEQLWQSLLFLHQTSLGSASARRGVNRLPFSFTQKDWRNYTKKELVLAYNFLYSVDHGLKNGVASFGLDLFMIRFLQSGFSS